MTCGQNTYGITESARPVYAICEGQEDHLGALIDIDFSSGLYWAAGAGAATFVALTGVSIARNSSAWLQLPDGSLQAYAVNEARIVATKGLTTEGARTNVIRRSAFTGGVDGSPGTLPTGMAVNVPAGLTRTLAFGTENGWPYMEVAIAGTVSTAGQIVIQTDTINLHAAANGQTWTGSIVHRLVSGALPGGATLSMWNRIADAANALVQSTTVVLTPGASRTRSTVTTAINQATAAFIGQQLFTTTLPISTVVNLTLRFYAPQQEQGAMASSPILTTGSTGTRLEDVISLTFASVDAPYSAFVDGDIEAVDDASNRAAFSLTGAAGDEVRMGRSSAAAGFIFATLASSLVMNRGVSGKGGARRLKLAVSRTDTTWLGSVDGVAVAETVAAAPGGLVKIEFGRAGGDNWFGVIRRVQAWRRSLSQSDINTLTAA